MFLCAFLVHAAGIVAKGSEGVVQGEEEREVFVRRWWFKQMERCEKTWRLVFSYFVSICLFLYV